MIPSEWIAVAAGAMATVVACLWRDNLKLRAALLKEKEEMVRFLQEILSSAQARRDD